MAPRPVLTRTPASAVPRRIRPSLAVLAVLVASPGLALLGPAPAGATTITYVGTTAGSQSTVVVHRSDEFRRELHPVGTVTAVLDDTIDRVTGGEVDLEPTFTPTFDGPAGVLVYARVRLDQLSGITGPAVPSAVDGITDLSVQGTFRLRLTVYVTPDGTQHPATDTRLTDPTMCFSDVFLRLRGTADRRAGTLDVGQDPFTIAPFPDGTTDPARTCGALTPLVNDQVAGSDNAADLHFTGGPTIAHYTGVTEPGTSTIVIKQDWPRLRRTFRPNGSITADIDFTTGQITGIDARFDPIRTSALPGLLGVLPIYARIDLVQQGTPTGSVGPTGTAGIDAVRVSATVRMALTVTLGSPHGFVLTNPSRCRVDLDLDLSGTVDRGTDVLTVGQDPFTIPSLPGGFRGCGLLSRALSALVSGPSNSIALRFVDGVVAAPTADGT